MAPKKKQRKSTTGASDGNKVIFKEGDLVGAKIKGHPLWPGRIETVHELANLNGKRKYTVRFFGSDDTSQSSIQIKLFEAFTDQEKACSRRGFKEALLLCQQEYDLLLSQSLIKATSKDVDEHAKEVEEDKISDYQSACSSPELKINTDPIEEPAILEKSTANRGKRKANEKPKEKPAKRSRLEPPNTNNQSSCESAPISIKSEPPAVTSTTTTSNKQSTIEDAQSGGDVITADGNSKKPADQDGENVKKHSETLRKLTLAKLQEKVKRKIKEKEDLKIELRERRSHTYYAPKLVLINKKLKHISSLANRFSRTTKFGKSDLQQWNSAVRIYQTLSTRLTKCVNFFNRNNMKLSPECRDCHETLVSIVTNVKRAQNDDEIASSTKKELKRIIKLMKNSDLIDFINDDMKNAMTERKENDAE